MQMSNPESHPDADLLTAFAEHSLTTREHDQVLAHLAACGSCREVVALAGSQLVEPVPEPVRKRALWEMPLFHWGAVAATTVVVIAAVSLGVRDRRNASQGSALYKEQAPAAMEQQDKVVAEPRAKTQVVPGPSEATSPAAPVAESTSLAPKRSLHLQQEARYERPSSATTKKQEIVAAAPQSRAVNGNIVPGAQDAKGTTRDYSAKLDSSANSNSPLRNEPADLGSARTTAAPPPAPMAQNQNVHVNNEIVTVDVANDQVKTDQSASGAAQITSQSEIVDKKVQEYSVAPLQKAARAKAGDFRWQIRDGKLQRSAAPNEWQTVLPTQTFRTFAVIQNHVWAGGDSGLLYHSADNGQSWTPVAVKSGTTALTGNIVDFRFTDAKHGSIQTSTGETWTTSDGGESWQKK